MKHLIAAAALLATAAPAFADDPIYVVRPPIVQMRANVLPANAFATSSAPSTPSQPSTPAPSQYVFKSYMFDETAAPWNVSAAVATVKVGKTYQFAGPSVGWCDVLDTWPTKTMSAFLATSQRYVTPGVTGKFALALMCDAVNNLPGTDPKSRFYAKAILNVIP